MHTRETYSAGVLIERVVFDSDTSEVVTFDGKGVEISRRPMTAIETTRESNRVFSDGLLAVYESLITRAASLNTTGVEGVVRDLVALAVRQPVPDKTSRIANMVSHIRKLWPR